MCEVCTINTQSINCNHNFKLIKPYIGKLNKQKLAHRAKQMCDSTILEQNIMKLFEGLKLIIPEGEVELKGMTVKSWLTHIALHHPKGYRGFVKQMLGVFGGRGYNQFLDYPLIAVKLNQLFCEQNRYKWKDERVDDKDWFDLASECVKLLLWDDRHDLYQNLPYTLDDLYKLAKEDLAGTFWHDIAKILIESFNCDGSGNICHKFEVEEN